MLQRRGFDPKTLACINIARQYPRAGSGPKDEAAGAAARCLFAALDQRPPAMEHRSEAIGSDLVGTDIDLRRKTIGTMRNDHAAEAPLRDARDRSVETHSQEAAVLQL